MSKYVALLRGINVGGRIIKSDELSKCFESISLNNVRTVIQSGNVLFESRDQPEAVKTKIETALTNKFNYSAKVQVIDLDKLKDIIKNYPFDRENTDLHAYVIFMENGLEKQIVNEVYKLTDSEKVKPGKGVIYWQVTKGQTLKTPFAKLQSKTKYRDFNTNRNLNTLIKIINQ